MQFQWSNTLIAYEPSFLHHALEARSFSQANKRVCFVFGGFLVMDEDRQGEIE